MTGATLSYIVATDTLAWIAAALALRVTGEELGCLGLDQPHALEAELTELEVHKTRYAGAP